MCLLLVFYKTTFYLFGSLTHTLWFLHAFLCVYLAFIFFLSHTHTVCLLTVHIYCYFTVYMNRRLHTHFFMRRCSLYAIYIHMPAAFIYLLHTHTTTPHTYILYNILLYTHTAGLRFGFPFHALFVLHWFSYFTLLHTGSCCFYCTPGTCTHMPACSPCSLPLPTFTFYIHFYLPHHYHPYTTHIHQHETFTFCACHTPTCLLLPPTAYLFLHTHLPTLPTFAPHTLPPFLCLALPTYPFYLPAPHTPLHAVPFALPPHLCLYMPLLHTPYFCQLLPLRYLHARVRCLLLLCLILPHTPLLPFGLFLLFAWHGRDWFLPACTARLYARAIRT